MLLMIRFVPVALAVVLLAMGAGRSESLPPGFVMDGQGLVASVTDGDTLRLADGREIRLVGIQAPKLPLGRTNYPAWPLGPEAKAALEQLVLKRTLSLYFGGAREDRNGRVLAQLVRDDGLWLQAEMLRKGLARVYTFPDNRTGISALLTAEILARNARRGIWAESFYVIRNPENLDGLTDTYQLVEGRVRKVSPSKRAIYLNFGEDWHSDFTLKIDIKDLALFVKAGFDPRSLEGQTLRVRGWLREAGGPLIQLTHPEQIERLDK